MELCFRHVCLQCGPVHETCLAIVRQLLDAWPLRLNDSAQHRRHVPQLVQVSVPRKERAQPCNARMRPASSLQRRWIHCVQATHACRWPGKGRPITRLFSLCMCALQACTSRPCSCMRTQHLSQDAADGPHVSSRAVAARPQQQLWGAIPARCNCMRVRRHPHIPRACTSDATPLTQVSSTCRCLRPPQRCGRARTEMTSAPACAASWRRARPKSATLRVPVRVSSRLEGFRSRCR